MGLMKPLRILCAVLAALLLSACAQVSPPPAREPEDLAAAPEEETAITPEEGAAILEAQLGTVDAATGICTSCGAVAFAPLGSEASAGKQEPRLGSRERA